MSLVFSTKANTLTLLESVLKTARIMPLKVFTITEWYENRNNCLKAIYKSLGPSSSPWIVRSSCSREDGAKSSNAGAFLSIPNVYKKDLEAAIDEVIASYGEVKPNDQLLVQPMLSNVIRSGVGFSHDPNTSSPYRIINWSEGDNTSFVTAGLGGRVWQHAANSSVQPSPQLKPILALIEELLTLFGDVPIDCEFAVTLKDKKEILWLLQARPLILLESPESSELQASRLNVIQNKLERSMKPHPFLMGSRTVYGVMPDWNPAEIVGIRPRPLSLSIYRELITDNIWAYQRHNYGYRNLRSFPLMPNFFGLPYIDVRLSFNSFIPADLNDSLANRLVDYYIDRLLSEPSLHDKVEFEIVFSCYSLDLPQRLKLLAKAGFSKSELESVANSLRKLTNRIVDPKEGLWRSDASKINELNSRREKLLFSSADPLERIYWLLEDAKRYGTLPFAGLARAGFIAVQMLKSLVTVGVFSQDDYDAFIESISTVSGQLARDRALLDKTTFLGRYGHLRPGTYDIMSQRYDEAPELYFDWNQRPPVPESTRSFTMTLHQMREIVKLLEEHGLNPDPVGLFDFMQAGIELREMSKFHFTRNLSDALALIAEVGGQYGFSREDLSYCDIGVFRELHVAAIDTRDFLLRAIDQGKARYEETLKISLPPVMSKPEDVWSFEWPESSPNFITRKQITAKVVSCEDREKLAGSIVCIPNADPGFDWLFAYPIAGLVTAWGGANSHMAIRAGELGLPAVIGAGEMLFLRWSAAQRLHLNCAGHLVEIVN